VNGENGEVTKSEVGSNYFEDESDDEIFLVKQDMSGQNIRMCKVVKK
jgi:hypothetical protein